jgi:glycosyltransferase involved in cell wall biosynthesis
MRTRLSTSIITISRNCCDDLRATIASVEPLAVDEYYVVDAASTDGTLDLLREVSLRYSGRMHWVSEPDCGIADAFNKGLDGTTGDLILFLNAGDSLIDPAYIFRAKALLEENSNIDFVHADVVFMDPVAGPICLSARESHPLGRGMPYRHQTMLVRREVFKQVGIFNTDYKVGMDYDLVCKMHEAGMIGMHDATGPVVRMDGTGVSVKRERLGMQEAVRSLKAAGLWNNKNRLGYLKRYLAWCVRKTLVFFKLFAVLARLKQRKYGRGIQS